jgi:hypothetical protein
VSTTRKILDLTSLVLLAAGLALFFWDAWTSHQYGVHMNEVAGITADGGPVDWPTGERPTFTLIPLFVYALVFLLPAAGVNALRISVGRGNPGRICRGTE